MTVGISKGSRGIEDLGVSVGELRITFDLLFTIDIIVVNLFFIDGSLELIKDFLNGVEGGVGLKLGFDFHHNVHDGSLDAEVKGVLGN